MTKEFGKFLEERGEGNLVGALQLLVEIHLYQTSNIPEEDLCLCVN